MCADDDARDFVRNSLNQIYIAIKPIQIKEHNAIVRISGNTYVYLCKFIDMYLRLHVTFSGIFFRVPVLPEMYFRHFNDEMILFNTFDFNTWQNKLERLSKLFALTFFHFYYA